MTADLCCSIFDAEIEGSRSQRGQETFGDDAPPASISALASRLTSAGISAGADDYIIKPSPRVLLERVEAAVSLDTRLAN